MITGLLLVALIAFQGGARGVPSADPAPPPALNAVVVGPVYQPNGGVAGEVAALSAGQANLVYLYSRQSLCDTGSVAGSEPAGAGFGWRLTTHVVTASAAELVMSVDWRRLWDRGQKLANGPGGTVQLTLHPGDAIPLDYIPNSVPTAACRAVGMGLEVRIARGAPSAPRAPAVPLPLGSTEGGAGRLDADLWLVHTLPSGAEQVQHAAVRLNGLGGAFNFPPLKLATTQGEIGVELTGSFTRFHAPVGGELIQVSMARRITGGTAPAGGLSGTTSSLIALPGPGEVLSFEMLGPAARGGPRGGGMAAVGAGGGGGRGSGGSGALVIGSGVTSAMPAAGSVGAAGAAGGRGRGAAGGGVAQVLTMLENHGFALRVRLTPTPGS